MTKTKSICKLCKSYRFVNYLGLCKRCNKNPDSLAIRQQEIAKRKENLEAEQEGDATAQEEQHERESLEAKEDLTTEQKERLVELISEVKNLQELDSYLEEKKKRLENKQAEESTDKKE